MSNEIRPIDANALILDMAAGCVPIDRPNISDVTGDEASILDYINAAPTLDYAPVNRWISVKERLPEIGKCVLTLDKWGHVGDRKLHRYQNGATVFTPDGLWPGKDITHWMPLPEPPKEVTDD